MHISKSIYLYKSIYLASLSFFEDVTNRFKASRRGNVPLSSLTPAGYTPPLGSLPSPLFFLVLWLSVSRLLRPACTTSSVPSPRFLRLRRDVGLGDLSGCDVVFLGVICGGLSYGRIYTGWEVQASGLFPYTYESIIIR